MTKVTPKFASILTTMIALSSLSLGQAFTHQSCTTKITHLSMAGGWGNNQERAVFDEEFGGTNGSPIYDSYEIEDRGEFMQRVNSERKSLRRKKASDLLEVARIAGVELKKKDKDPEKLDLFDAEDMISGDDYLDVSI
ncbi:hypothetical protein ACHAWT_006466 [Skeletonema menzelii]|mmetsp:Transcript_17853/g.29235  ORF Transcript_17853/g.29235 Transcript_17853/m.29235 type:complete len:138 (-) Transcript_17853:1493-1906(-)